MTKIVRQKTAVKKFPKIAIKLPKYFIYGLVILVVAGLIYLGGKLFFAASVNGQLISRLSIIKELEKTGGKKTLDNIILKTLIVQEAKKQKAVVTQKDIDAQLLKVEANIAAQGATLDQLLEQQGMTRKELNEELKIQLMVTKMVDKGITVSEKEIDGYIASRNEQVETSGTSAPELTRSQVAAQLKQQKLTTKIQSFVADLKAKAKINYFVSY